MNAKYVVEGCNFRILQRVERERGRKIVHFSLEGKEVSGM